MATLKSAAALAALALLQQAQAWNIDLPVCTQPFEPFVYSGCYQDLHSPAALTFRSTLSSYNMTMELCVAECKGNGFRYAGLEYYGECFCGETVNGPQVDDAECKFPCTGNKSETCGGNNLLSVWQDTTFLPLDNQTVADYVPLGCYTDNSTIGRALGWPMDLPAANLTTEACLSACLADGYPFAGTEYGGQCWCGAVIGNFSTHASASECSMACTGDASEKCGGRSRLSLYVAKDLESLQPCGYVSAPSSSSSVPPASWTTTSSSSFAWSNTTTSSSTWSTSFAVSNTTSIWSTPTSSFAVSNTTSIWSTPTSSSPWGNTTSTSSTPTSSSAWGNTTSIWSTPTSSFAVTNTTTSSSTLATSFPWGNTTCISSTSTSSFSVKNTTSISSTSTSVSWTPASSTVPPSSTPTWTASSTSSSSSESCSSTSTTETSSSTSTSTSTSSSSSSSESCLSTSTLTSSVETSSSTSTCSTSTSSAKSSTSSSAVPSSTTSTVCSTTTTSSTHSTTSPHTTTTKPSTTTHQTSTTTSSLCTATYTVPSKCEYGCGSWCSSELPDFDDVQGCKDSQSSCQVQIAACFKEAGWPGSMDCFDFAGWCDDISGYCSSGGSGSGSCSKSDCISKWKPKGGQPPTTSTSVGACLPTTTAAKTTTTTTTSTKCPIPTATGICKQPSNPGWGYKEGSPVGGIGLPVVTCNDLKDDFDSGNQFKLYDDSDSTKCASYPRKRVPSACADACKVQYDLCVATYAEGCKSNGGGGGGGGGKSGSPWFSRSGKRGSPGSYFDWYRALHKRIAWTDSYGTATSKCEAQYGDCLVQNEGVTGSGKCGSWGTGW